MISLHCLIICVLFLMPLLRLVFVPGFHPSTALLTAFLIVLRPLSLLELMRGVLMGFGKWFDFGDTFMTGFSITSTGIIGMAIISESVADIEEVVVVLDCHT